MKRMMLMVLVTAFVLTSAQAFAGKCEFYGWKEKACLQKADYTPASKCAYYQWKQARCRAEKPVAAPAPKVEKIQKGEKLVLEGIYFDTGSARIKKESFSVLDANVQKIQNSSKGLKIEVVGYTDDRGSDQMNQRLSQARAKSVKDYMISKGVDEGRISSVGRGESSPVADNATEAGRSKNRRIELEAN